MEAKEIFFNLLQLNYQLSNFGLFTWKTKFLLLIIELVEENNRSFHKRKKSSSVDTTVGKWWKKCRLSFNMLKALIYGNEIKLSLSTFSYHKSIEEKFFVNLSWSINSLVVEAQLVKFPVKQHSYTMITVSPQLIVVSTLRIYMRIHIIQNDCLHSYGRSILVQWQRKLSAATMKKLLEKCDACRERSLTPSTIYLSDIFSNLNIFKVFYYCLSSIFMLTFRQMF